MTVAAGPASTARGGLRGLADRVEALGGTFRLESRRTPARRSASSCAPRPRRPVVTTSSIGPRAAEPFTDPRFAHRAGSIASARRRRRHRARLGHHGVAPARVLVGERVRGCDGPHAPRRVQPRRRGPRARPARPAPAVRAPPRGGGYRLAAGRVGEPGDRVFDRVYDRARFRLALSGCRRPRILLFGGGLSRGAAVLVAAGYAIFGVVLGLVPALTFDAAAIHCSFCPDDLVAVVRSSRLAGTSIAIGSARRGRVVGLVAVFLAVSVVRQSAAARTLRAPLYIPGALFALVLALELGRAAGAERHADRRSGPCPSARRGGVALARRGRGARRVVQGGAIEDERRASGCGSGPLAADRWAPRHAGGDAQRSGAPDRLSAARRTGCGCRRPGPRAGAGPPPGAR